MAQPNGLNPQFPGPVKALAFSTNSGAALTQVVNTNTTTAVNVFGTTNGFAGNIIGVKVTAKDATASNITLATNSGTVAVIAKGTSVGGVTGSAISSVSFTATGTCTVVSSGSGNALVEVLFTPTLPS